MWPWGHLAVGYLCFSAYSHLRRGRPPSALPALLLAVATQIPDLIDKPLAWTVGILPNGRSLGHSLVVALPILALAWYILPKNRKRLFAPVALGYLSHVATDALHPLLTGEFHYVGFLGWPLIPPLEYATGQSFLAHLTTMEVTPWFSVQLLLVVVTMAVWIADGAPGLRAALSVVTAGRKRVAETLAR